MLFSDVIRYLFQFILSLVNSCLSRYLQALHTRVVKIELFVLHFVLYLYTLSHFMGKKEFSVMVFEFNVLIYFSSNLFGLVFSCKNFFLQNIYFSLIYLWLFEIFTRKIMIFDQKINDKQAILFHKCQFKGLLCN